MESYFKSHSCDNPVCQALGLHDIKSVPEALEEVRAHIQKMALPASEAANSPGSSSEWTFGVIQNVPELLRKQRCL